MTMKKTTKTRTKPQAPPQTVPMFDTEASNTINCIHVIVNNLEHTFFHSKVDLLNYLSKKEFKTIHIAKEAVPTNIAY